MLGRLAPVGGVEEVRVTEEDEYFPPPPELRDLAAALGGALALGLGAPAPATGPVPGDDGFEGPGAPVRDRHVSAADVLARLAG